MVPSTGSKAAAWTAAISVTAVLPHEALVVLGAVIAKEAFDLVSLRMHRTSVLAYLRTVGAQTSLTIGPWSAAPALSLSNASSRPGPPAGEEGAALMPGDDDPAVRDLSPDVFCVEQRADWLAYAMARTRSFPDAEDAVSHVTEKIYEHYAAHGTACPDGRDPVGWSKTVIRNYLADQWRRSKTRDRYSRALLLPGVDIAENVTDHIIAGKALAFIGAQDDQTHMIAMMAWVDGLKPREIAKRLGLNNIAVRKSLYRTRKELRRKFGVAEPRGILEEGKA